MFSISIVNRFVGACGLFISVFALTACDSDPLRPPRRQKMPISRPTAEAIQATGWDQMTVSASSFLTSQR